MKLLLEHILEIIVDAWVTLFGISIGVVIILAFGKCFDTSIGSLICSLAYLSLVALIGTLIRQFFDNSVGKSLEEFLVWFCALFGPPLGDLFYSESSSNVLKLILEISLGPKVRYPELVSFHLQATLAVTSVISDVKFPPPPSVKIPTSPLRAIIAVNLSGIWHTLP